MEFIKFFGVVFMMMGAEMLCTLYIIATEKRQAFKAALYCSVMVLLASLITINYVHDKKLLIAEMIGAFLGTFIITKIKNK